MKNFNNYKIAALLFILSVNLIYAQDLIYEAYNSIELPNPERIRFNSDGGFIVSGVKDSGLTQTIFDDKGNISGSKLFSSDFRITSFNYISNDDYILILADTSEDNTKYYLQRLSKNFVDRWTIEIKSIPPNTIPKIHVTEDNWIVIFTIEADNQSLWFSHYSEDGDRISNKIFTLYFDIKTPPNVILLHKFGFYYLSVSGYFRKIDGDNKVIWGKNFTDIRQIIVLNDRSTLIISEKSIFKYDADGNLLKQTFTPQSNIINSALITGDDKLIICTNLGITKYNLDLELEWSENLRINCSDIITDNNSFVYGIGEINIANFKRSAFVKIPYTGILYQGLSLIYPNGSEEFYDPTGKIYWYSKNINRLNIHFSSDNGNSWATIGSTYSNNKNVYNWSVPQISSNNCVIKISDIDNPMISDQSKNPFSIYNYKTYDYISANEIFMYIGNNGMSAHDPVDDDSGLYWPGGDSAKIPLTFADGIVWGGKVNGQVRVGGSTYRYGLTPGPILENGISPEPHSQLTRIFKLKSGWEHLPESEEKQMYKLDYDNWPGQHGAPYEDINWDKEFSPGIDKPEILGDETLFYAANDLNADKTYYLYGSPPLGLEFQQTLFAYNKPELKDVVFKKVKLINKSKDKIEDMYLSYWTDDDLGFAGDDYVGCDTILNIGYTFNGDNYDDDNFDEAPPVIGRLLLQGPIVESVQDTAIYDNRFIANHRNIPMTAFALYIGANAMYSDSDLGEYHGSVQMYNYMQGYLWDRSPFIDPNNGKTTHFCLPGDPVEGSGWYEGGGWPGGAAPDDRRYLMSSGPFVMAPGDTQEVVYAIILARGDDNIDSITKLKEKVKELKIFWKNFINEELIKKRAQIVKNYYISQNYPNPFNPTTKIEYTIPHSESGSKNPEFVSLIVYDILGREVSTLVNEKQKPGKYWVDWDASKYATGIYFYRISIGNYVRSKKMLLLK
jgi:hypothetical protein